MTAIELRISREYMGLARVELARKLGVSQRDVYAWEHDLQLVPVHIAEHITRMGRAHPHPHQLGENTWQLRRRRPIT